MNPCAPTAPLSKGMWAAQTLNPTNDSDNDIMTAMRLQRHVNDDDGDSNNSTATLIQQHPTKDFHPHAPSPLQREVLHAWRKNMRRRTQGGTQEVGSPANASRKRTTTKVVVHFCPSLHAYPPSTIRTAQKVRMWPIENTGSLAMAHTAYQRHVRPIDDTHAIDRLPIDDDDGDNNAATTSTTTRCRPAQVRSRGFRGQGC